MGVAKVETVLCAIEFLPLRAEPRSELLEQLPTNGRALRRGHALYAAAA